MVYVHVKKGNQMVLNEHIIHLMIDWNYFLTQYFLLLYNFI